MLGRVLLACAVSTSLGGCVGPRGWVEPVDLKAVPMEERAAASAVRIYETGQAPPSQLTALGDVRATSCKNKTWDPPATKGDALQQLRLRAHRLGATAIIDVVTDERGTDTWGTNCWESVTVSGIAVRVEQAGLAPPAPRPGS